MPFLDDVRHRHRVPEVMDQPGLDATQHHEALLTQAARCSRDRADVEGIERRHTQLMTPIARLTSPRIRRLAP